MDDDFFPGPWKVFWKDIYILHVIPETCHSVWLFDNFLDIEENIIFNSYLLLLHKKAGLVREAVGRWK